MNVTTAVFIKSAVKPSQYPTSHMPEFAFAGRSNVGKSSVINTLVGRKKLVKTSGAPGRTQTINFFLVNDSLYFTDLPGYGYAKVPIEVKQQWGPMVETYFQTRSGLRSVIVILDIRRLPNEGDQNLVEWLRHYDIPAIMVLTKADKLKKGKQAEQRKKIAEVLSVSPSDMVLFSSLNGKGRRELWAKLKGFL